MFNEYEKELSPLIAQILYRLITGDVLIFQVGDAFNLKRLVFKIE